MDLFKTFVDPPREYGLIPFWFLNDDLDEAELKRQLDGFRAHGVYGVVPHARMGLPEELAFMSDRWMHFLKVIVDYAAETGMQIILYDEGMYPSGSCAGQVVAKNPRHATRCLQRRRRKKWTEDEEVVAEDDKYIYVNTRSMGHIRGVHYGMDDGQPGAPPSGDILNPEAVGSFLHLVHDKHYAVLGPHFGKTVTGIFTDEPDVLGRGRRGGVRAWTWGFEGFLEEYLGHDFRPHLAALWSKKYPDAERHKSAFDRAVNARLDAAYYAQYHEWCLEHGVAFTGHPAGPMDMGLLRHFDWPGQDVVWRYLEPFQDKSLEGEQSTMGKSSASAKVHYGRSRNLNECFGAYGWEFTYEEMRWLTNWLLVRGVDMISPHAFYYSVRGDRRDERPPDVGPNNTWWDGYKGYADFCRRLSWLVAEGRQACAIAVLGTPTYLPWRAARVLFESQHDFNYLDSDTLVKEAEVSPKGIAIRNMRYEALVIDDPSTAPPEILGKLQPIIDAGRVFPYLDPVAGIPGVAGDSKALLAALDTLVLPDVRIEPANASLRYHHTVHGGTHFYLFTNEGPEPFDVSLSVGAEGPAVWWDPETATVLEDEDPKRIALRPYTAKVLCLRPS